MATSEARSIGTNVTVRTEGTIVTITIDTSEDHGPSASGKTHIVASTHGFQAIPGGDVKVNITAIRKE